MTSPTLRLVLMHRAQHLHKPALATSQFKRYAQQQLHLGTPVPKQVVA